MVLLTTSTIPKGKVEYTFVVLGDFLHVSWKTSAISGRNDQIFTESIGGDTFFSLGVNK